MLLRVLGSSSAGNCYLLEGEKEVLVIETGIPFREVKKALDFDISKIVGVVASHAHGDHAKYVGEYEKSGIPTFKPYEQFKPYVAFGGFTIMPVEMVHDVPCYGFYINHKDMGNLLYASDTEYIREVFTGVWALNHILVEANYADGLVPPDIPHRAHVLKGHMSLRTCLNFLDANNNDGLQNVVLCHLSSQHADPVMFWHAAGDVVNCNVKIAAPGLVVELGKPFWEVEV